LRLEAYFNARQPDLADDMRVYVAGTLRLANASTHHPRMGRPEAVSAARSAVLLVRVLQEIDRTPRKHRRSAAGPRRATENLSGDVIFHPAKPASQS